MINKQLERENILFEEKKKYIFELIINLDPLAYFKFQTKLTIALCPLPASLLY